MVRSDFMAEYGIRLRGWDGTWREFMDYLQGLADADTRIARRFFTPDDPQEA